MLLVTGGSGQRRDAVAGRAVRRLVPLHEGWQPAYTYNCLGLSRDTVAAPQARPPGHATDETADMTFSPPW
jgi:hypothetical protein